MPEDDVRGTSPDAELAIVICTYDNPVLLDRVLTGLARQQGAEHGWNVTVVDNNSPDETRAVVARHQLQGAIPGLRRVVEPTQGLTPARLRGVLCTTERWIAFVDDDCVPEERWVECALAFARTHQKCGGFGGRVTPEYDGNPSSVLLEYGWLFAEQRGDRPAIVDCLVGAGMVLNREALELSGWPSAPYFADRVGRRLIYGGDVEIALRVKATGRPLWFVPECSLRHLISEYRTSTQHLVRIARGLGVSFILSTALVATGSRAAWARATLDDLARTAAGLLKRAPSLFRGFDAGLDTLLAWSYELGRWMGAARVTALMLKRQGEFFGQARGG